MKTLLTLALAAVFALSAGQVSAQPGYPPRYPGSGYGDRDRGYDRHRGHDRDQDNYSRIEARAQLRLRQLGYYNGRIDGSFGNQSRRALVRFQRDYRLPMTGRLDRRTLRALRLR